MNTSPNALGRLDTHKIGFAHRQLHPSGIGKVDLLAFSKDVGQSGVISPWADLSDFSRMDINKYPNIKFDLYQFIVNNFPNPTLRFNARDIVEYNQVLDKLVTNSYMELNYRVKRDDET